MIRPALLAALLAALPGAALAAPLTLDDALALASRQSHDLVISRADADLAGGGTLGAYQGLLPRLDLFGSGARQISSRARVYGENRVVFSVPGNTTDSYLFNLQLTQPLVDLGAWRQLAQARQGELAATRGYDEARLSVAFAVTRTFYELVKAERSLAVLEKAAARSEELVARADALYAAGRAAKADTFTARVNLGNDRIAVEQGRLRAGQARSDLAVALGQPGDAAVEVVPPLALEGPGAPSTDLPAVEALVATARARRPSLLAAAAQAESARAGVDAAQAGYLPTLSAQASLNRAAQDFGGTYGAFGLSGRQNTVNVGLALNWNLFAGRSTDAAVQRARASADRAQATAGKTADTVAQEIATARQRVLGLSREVALSAENLGAADQGLALARQRLDAGLASQLEVRDATLKLTQAELSLVQARIDHAVAVADLARAVGGAL